MKRQGSKSRLNSQILEEAAEWLIELNSAEADQSARRRFDAWLRTSPEHLRAYLELLPVWEDGAALPRHSSIEDLIEMGKRADANVVALDVHSEVRGSDARVRAVPRGRLAFALAACLIFVTILGGLAWFQFGRGVYTTGIGEQRSLVLEDGSTLNLNARSKVRVHFTANLRAIELIEGQALFNVAKNAAKPFVVSVGKTQVRAVGTQFDVNRRRRDTVVTVVDGTVAVSGDADVTAGRAGETAEPRSPEHVEPTATHHVAGIARQAGEFLVTAGEQVTVTVSGSATPRAVPANLASATAWTQRRLIFDASTLGEVVEEFNRYNTRRLVLRDDALERFPITAAFSSTDPASLVRFLEAQPSLRIVTTNDEIEISLRP